ncbi:BUD17 (YNR027W) [Zygosaccharomyces parabailii]|nr:BUD17 (YNR027W) [Zygosaccharomyces parabailii]
MEPAKDVMTPMSSRNVLSIQSHVVHGYVGNKAATFPLQYRGWNVDALNTVQFSNHPGYGYFTGFRYNAEHLQNILSEGLIKCLGIHYDAILMGYLPGLDSLLLLGESIGRLCSTDPHLRWVLDPVLGDNGRLYVPEENVAVYQDILRNNKVHVVTPNQFEMETLTGIGIVDLKSLKRSFKVFHQLYPKVQGIVVTSLELGDEYICACDDGFKMQYSVVPRLNAHFSGSGDLFNALLLDALVPARGEPPALSCALKQTIALVDNILRRTLQLSVFKDDQLPITIKDLKLIQCRDILRKKDCEMLQISMLDLK